MKPPVFYDTNTLLDLLQSRQGCEEMKVLVQLGLYGEIDNCVSVLSMADIAYVMRKSVPGDQIRSLLSKYAHFFRVLPMDGRDLSSALSAEGPDIEDNMQISCAVSQGCRYILTRNKIHFNGSPVPVYTPGEFLELIAG